MPLLYRTVPLVLLGGKTGAFNEFGANPTKAGDYKIGYQSCDDATAQAGKWDSGKCSQNANAYAGNDKVLGIIGTFNSGCAAIIIPVVNQAPNGGIAMTSPAMLNSGPPELPRLMAASVWM